MHVRLSNGVTLSHAEPSSAAQQQDVPFGMHKPLFPSPSVYNPRDHIAVEKSHQNAVRIKHGGSGADQDKLGEIDEMDDEEAQPIHVAPPDSNHLSLLGRRNANLVMSDVS